MKKRLLLFASSFLLTSLISAQNGNGNYWELNGNANTNGTSFLGTTDFNPIIFKTNNSEISRYTSEGKLGLNISTPKGQLHINSIDEDEAIIIGYGPLENATRQNSIIFTDPSSGIGNNAIRWNDGSGALAGNIAVSSYNGPHMNLTSTLPGSRIEFIVGGPNTSFEKMRLTHQGEIGLGTTSPQANFHIVSQTSNEAIIIGDKPLESNTFENSIIFTESGSGIGNNQIRWLDGDGEVVGAVGASLYNGPHTSLNSNKPGSYIRFIVGGTSQVYEKMRLTSGGRLGIRTGTPTAALHVKGNARIETLPTPTVPVDMVVADEFGNLYKLSTNSFNVESSSLREKELENELARMYELTETQNERLNRLEQKAGSDVTNITNYPNPFTNSTTISYNLNRDAIVDVSIINSAGELVTNLFNGNQSQGYYQLEWDTENLAPGSYFYTVTIDDQKITNRAVLVK